MTKPTTRKGPAAAKASGAPSSTVATKKVDGHRRQQPTNGRAVTAGKDGKKPVNGASGDAVAKEDEAKEEEQPPQEEEKKFEPSTHMEADLVETLGN